MNTGRSCVPSPTFIGSISRRAVLGRLAAGGVGATLLAPMGRRTAQARATPGLRREEPNRFVLAGAETTITYDATAAAGGPRLTYQGPYGDQTFGGDSLTTEESALGRLVTVHLGAFPDQGELWLTLLLPRFNPVTIGDDVPAPFATLAILKWLVSTIAGPPPTGALEEYDVVPLEGTAQLVSTLPEGVAVDQLGAARLGRHDLPPAIDSLALTRVTFPPATTVTVVGGAHLFVVETGALAVQKYLRVDPPPMGTPGPVAVELPGGPSSYGVGDRFLIGNEETPPPTISNDETEPAVALVISLTAAGGGIGESLTGGAVVAPLAVVDAARVGPPLAAGGTGDERIAIALVRVTYEREASLDLPDILEPAAHLLAVEAGAVNVVVGDPALLAPVDGAPRQLPPDSRVSLVPGDQVLVATPGAIATRNVARGPSTILTVSVATAPAATGQG